MTVKVGTRVRGYDFDNRNLVGDRASYIEGVIESIGVFSEGCDRYAIRVDRDVFGGKESKARVGQLVFPPLNGTPSLFGGVTNFVEVLTEENK